MSDKISFLKESAFNINKNTAKLEELYEILKNFTTSEVLKLLNKEALVYVHTHFWSLNLNINGDWCRKFPMYFCRDQDPQKIQDDLLAFFVFFFLRGQKLLRNFSVISFTFRNLPQKFGIIVERKPPEELIHAPSLVSITKLAGIVQSVKIQIPHMDFESEREKALNSRIFGKENSTRRHLTEFIEKTKQIFQAGLFVDSFHFDKLVDHFIKDEQGSILANEFEKELEQKGDEFFERITTELEPLTQSWNISEELVSNFLKVLFAHNLLPHWKYLYIFPSKVLKIDNFEMGFGGIYVASQENISEETLNTLYILLNLKYRTLATQDWANYSIRSIKAHATKSAIAAIMSRNMSHNIGSHVMFYIGQETNAAIRLALNRYIQERMDFIAEIVTSQPTWMMPMMIYGDILKPLASDELSQLKKNIAASEGIQNILFHYYIGAKKIVQQGPARGKFVEEDIGSAIVSGNTGKQAFYAILENLIRNAAKYGKNNDSPLLEVSVRIDEQGFSADETYLRIRIWENRTHCDSALSRKINQHIQRPFTNEEGLADREALGIKEMRACAAFLRGLMPYEAEVNRASIVPALLRAFSVNDSGGEVESDREGWLAYEFYLFKPQEACVVDAYLNSKDDFRQQLEKQYGVYIQKELRQAAFTRRFHHYLFIQKFSEKTPEIPQMLHQSRSHMPSRMLLVDAADETVHQLKAARLDKSIYQKFQDAVSGASAEQSEIFLLKAYQQWICNFVGNTSTLVLLINLAPNPMNELESNPLRQKWLTIEERFNQLFAEQNFELQVITRPPGAKQDLYSAQKNYLVYDRHMTLQDARCIPACSAFYEKISGGKPGHDLFFSLPQSKMLQMKRVLALFEAALLRILLVDERIANTVNETQQKDLERVGIFVSRAIQYDAPLPEDLEKLMGEVSSGRHSYHIIVIHQGILDKILNHDPEKSRDFVARLKEFVPFVVMMSGRGVPEDVPENAQFVSASGVLRFAVEQSSKYHLVQLLLAAQTMKPMKG